MHAKQALHQLNSMLDPSVVLMQLPPPELQLQGPPGYTVTILSTPFTHFNLPMQSSLHTHPEQPLRSIKHAMSPTCLTSSGLLKGYPNTMLCPVRIHVACQSLQSHFPPPLCSALSSKPNPISTLQRHQVLPCLCSERVSCLDTLENQRLEDNELATLEG